MHFSQFSYDIFSKFSKSVPPPKKNPGYAHGLSKQALLLDELKVH